MSDEFYEPAPCRHGALPVVKVERIDMGYDRYVRPLVTYISAVQPYECPTPYDCLSVEIERMRAIYAPHTDEFGIVH